MKPIGDIIDSIVEWPKKKPQRVYVTVIRGCYDGDNSDANYEYADTDIERARSKYLVEANDSEEYFLNKFEEQAVINRDDDAMYCECSARTEDFCRYHNVVYVRTFEL